MIGPKRRSGKGTIFRVLGALLGKENVVSPTMAALNTGFGLQPLIGKIAALVPDARFNSRHDAITERLLSISGEDALTIDRRSTSQRGLANYRRASLSGHERNAPVSPTRPAPWRRGSLRSR